MNEKNEPRNQKGDMELGKFDHEQSRKSRYTYVFNYFDEQKQHYFPVFELFSLSVERLKKASKNPDYFEVELFSSPETPPYDFHIHHSNLQLDMLIGFFKEVFQEQSFAQGYLPGHKFFKVILPRETYLQIINTINDFGLLPIRDLILEVIATAQQIYTREIAGWERPERQKLITSAERETAKAMKVLEKLDDTAYLQGDPKAKPSDLLRINFIFNDEAVRLEHPWLTREFIDQFKQHYDKMHFKDWRKDLARFPSVFTEEIENQKFKYKLAISLYNLLTKTGLFVVDQKTPTPNQLMLCIAKLLEFCLIKVAAPGEVDAVKEKQVRNWIGRNKIKPALTYAHVSFDQDRLLKYFETEFLALGDETKRLDAINIGYLIAERFSLQRLEGDLIHIAQCLQQINFFIGNQVTIQGDRGDNLPKEFDSFRKLLNEVKSGKKITSMKFTLEGDSDNHEFSQRLPLYQLEEAIKYYMEDQRVEIDTDLLLTAVEKNGNAFNIKKSNSFALPENRFMVRFVKSFYDYLMAESPPGEFESFPSIRYYEIIAVMMVRSGFFYRHMIDERFAAEKVKQWHNLSLGE